MRSLFFILLVVCGLSIKAQSSQSGQVKVYKRTYTAQEKYDMENDTTGKYRIGILPKKADATNTEKQENTTTTAQKDVSAAIAPSNVVQPTILPHVYTKEDSVRIEKIRAYKPSNDKKTVKPK